MSIQCGHCRGTHETIPQVRECARADHAARAVPAPAPPAERPAGGLAEEGVYRRQGKVFRVVTKDGRRFAEEMVRGKYVYAKGMVYRLGPADRLTLEEAKAWGRREIRCIRCGTALEKKESREAGIGPVCATKI